LTSTQREVTPQKRSSSAQGHDRRTLPLLLSCFGGERRPDTLNVRDWQSYIRRRSSGELAPKYKLDKKGKRILKPVRARIIEQDLKLLLAVLNWAERARADGSGYLLDRNPLRGLKLPREESPRPPMFTPEQCVAVWRAAQQHSPTAERFVLLAWYTGHRSSAIRQLRWSDIDLEAGTIRWRARSTRSGTNTGTRSTRS
jgi:integrase